MGNKTSTQMNKDIYHSIMNGNSIKTISEKIYNYSKHENFNINEITCYNENNFILIDAICFYDNINVDILNLLHKNGSIIKSTTLYKILVQFVQHNKNHSDNISRYEDILKYIYELNKQKFEISFSFK